MKEKKQHKKRSSSSRSSKTLVSQNKQVSKRGRKPKSSQEPSPSLITGLESMVQARKDGTDRYTQKAAEFFGVTTAEVTPAMRQHIKATVFFETYGTKGKSLTEQIHLNQMGSWSSGKYTETTMGGQQLPKVGAFQTTGRSNYKSLD